MLKDLNLNLTFVGSVILSATDTLNGGFDSNVGHFDSVLSSIHALHIYTAAEPQHSTQWPRK